MKQKTKISYSILLGETFSGHLIMTSKVDPKVLSAFDCEEEFQG
jgi:hypothetical protein